MPAEKSPIEKLLKAKTEIISGTDIGPVVLSTRIRLARNLDRIFPGQADEKLRVEIFKKCKEAATDITPMKQSSCLEIHKLNELERQILVERHLISPEFTKSRKGSGVIVNKDQSCAIMVNEEDHLRIQVLKSGFNFEKAWRAIDSLDSNLEGKLDYAFSPEFGYLTACPTNLGTGMRASVMMHLPGLVISDQMEKVIRAVNQLGIAVRGLFGEGSDASGSLFQISNRQTLGESEQQIIKRLTGVFNTIIEQELNARNRLLEGERTKLHDKIGRAFGILIHGHCVTSGESMNLLSLMRLAVDLGVFPESHRAAIDCQFINSQPGHIQMISDHLVSPEERDGVRSQNLRELFRSFPEPLFR